jgi:hypothetical protein
MKNYSRRNFVKSSVALGAISLLHNGIFSKSTFAQSLFKPPDITIVHGKDYFNNTLKAINKLRVLKKAFRKGKKVGLLINSDFTLEGAYVNPDIVLATIEACLNEGAQEIVCLQYVKPEYWKRSQYYSDYQDTIESVKNIEANTFPAKFNEEFFVKKENIESSKYLKTAEIVKELFKCNVFINTPIIFFKAPV